MRKILIGSLALLFAACGAQKSATDDTFSDLSGQDSKSDAFSKRMKVLGELQNQSYFTVDYTTTPKYRAVTFQATRGDDVKIGVTSDDGDPTVWILDAGYHILAHDNAQAGDDGAMFVNVETTVTKSGKFFVVMRDRELNTGVTFSVWMEGATSNDFYSCQIDADCVATAQNECCGSGRKVAVNKDQVDAYHASFDKASCPNQVCPLFLIDDTRLAECNRATKQCEMVAITDIKCGGFNPNPHACPAGYNCASSGVPDLPGTCQQKPTCIDNILCAGDYHFDNVACGCVPNVPDNCGGCATGTTCTFCWGNWACIPDGALC
jgi:hypothetical protein